MTQNLRNNRTQRAKLTLTHRKAFIQVLRTGLRLLPHGIGSAIDFGYFGSIEARRSKRMEQLVKELRDDLENLSTHEKERIDKTFFETDEFAFFLENVLRRLVTEVAREKLTALRGILVSVIVDQPFHQFDKKASFLKTIDVIEAVHIRILRLLASKHTMPHEQCYVAHGEICRTLGARTEADTNFLYSAIDTLANREFIVSGPVPFDATGRIDKPRQPFRTTPLGIEFLEFIRMPPREGKQGTDSA